VTGAYIEAIEYYIPSRTVTNADLADFHPEWQMDQVELKTGVESRQWCGPDETALDLAEGACGKLFDRTDFDKTQIDAILFCTQSPDHIMPPNACLLQHRLGLRKTVAAFDYTLACSGFIYGLYLARALVLSGSAQHVLLVTSETYSKWIHPDDRGPATLFGDGAAAALISSGKDGVGPFRLGTDGSGAACFMIPAGGARLPRSSSTAHLDVDRFGNRRSKENLYMNGPAVLDFVKKEIPSFVRGLLAETGLTLDDIDLVIFHQASQLTLDFLKSALKIPEGKTFNNLLKKGNTVSASIPIALCEAEQLSILRPQMRVLLVGFGVGLSWGGCIINWIKGL
jgi:3-oxoacyl-[acyl-carrier-protein] synthase III